MSDEVEDFFPVASWRIRKLVKMDESGVWSQLVLYLWTYDDDDPVRLVFPPRVALKLGANIVEIAADE